LRTSMRTPSAISLWAPSPSGPGSLPAISVICTSPCARLAPDCLECALVAIRRRCCADIRSADRSSLGRGRRKFLLEQRGVVELDDHGAPPRHLLRAEPTLTPWGIALAQLAWAACCYVRRRNTNAARNAISRTRRNRSATRAIASSLSASSLRLNRDASR